MQIILKKFHSTICFTWKIKLVWVWLFDNHTIPTQNGNSGT